MIAPHPLPQWWDAASQHACGIGTARPEAMPKPAPKWALQEWATFRAWNAWKNAGGHAPRPTFLWLTQRGPDKRKVPEWSWTLRAQWLKVHAPPAPPPAPERQYSRWTLDQIGGFGFRLAWVFTSGAATGRYTPTSLVDRVKHAREPHTGRPIRYLSIEGYPASDGTMFEGRSMDNEPFMDELIAACHAAGLQARLWERTDLTTFEHIKAILERHPGFDVYEADLEEMRSVDQSIASKFATDPVLKDMPRSTLYAGMDDASYYQPWIEADFAAGTQAYSHESWPGGHPVPPGIAIAMNNDCWWRGCRPIKRLNGLCSIPMLGVNQEGDSGVAHQLPVVEAFDGNWGIEWFESCNAADLALFGI